MEHEVSPATSSENTVLRSEITQLRQALEEHIGGEAVRGELAELRRALEGRDNELAELRRALLEHKSKEEHLTSMVELISGREQVIREMLLDAHDQLLRRDEEIQVTLASVLQQSGPVVTGPIASSNASLPGKYLQYQLMVHRVREVVRDTLPKGATVLCMLPDTGERYLSTALFAHIPADMSDEEMAISRSTPAAQVVA